MERTKKCFECGLGFPRVGIITSEERLREHEKTPHEVQCRECGTFFVSDVHVKYHLGFNHDTRCIDCYSYCERSCSEKYALKAELTGKEEMEMGLAEKKIAITDAEAELKNLINGLTNSHKETFQNMAKYVDIGYSGPEAEQWSKLLYLPFPMMPEKDVSSNIMSWIQLGDYEASVDEQISKVNQIVIKKCPLLGCDHTFIDEWSHRWQYHSDLFKSVKPNKATNTIEEH